jgi:hypothetical protein
VTDTGQGPNDGTEFTRVCSHCSTASKTDGGFCPNCGHPYVKRQRLSRRVRIVIAVVALSVFAAAGATAVILKTNHDKSVAQHHQQAFEHARVVADEEKVQAELKEHSEEASRKELESELEKAIERDANKRVSEGTLEGPILGANCTPSSGGNAHDLSSTSGTYSCMAITKREGNGESSGYRFTATVDFAKSEYSWHLGG